MLQSKISEESKGECDPGITLGDLLPIIADLNLAPHWAITAMRSVNSWPLTKDQKLEIIWLSGKIVESKEGSAEDVEKFLVEVHRLQESKVCFSEDILKALRTMNSGKVGRYGFQE